MEGENVTLEIMIVDNITQTLVITVLTEDISAVSGSDYSAVLLRVNFTSGYGSHPLIIQALQDNHAELIETFRVVLSQPSLGIEENTTVYIIDSNGIRNCAYNKPVCCSIIII